jgi:tetratricopeptide (TPR) repeat protein
VLVQASLGDMIADRLPMIGLFNHVLVRAHIGARDYWLDGTRAGDSDLDSIEMPDFGWGLPILADSKLVRMVPAPLAMPSLERHVGVDASGGVYAPATITIDETYRGDSAVGMNAAYSAVTGPQRDQALHDEAKGFFDDFSTDSSSIQFDQKKREFHISIKGTAKLNWKDGWFYVPTSSIAFDPDFDRPAGPLHDVPVQVNHPRYTKDEATIRLPAGFAARQKIDPPVRETLAGVEYVRNELVNGNTLTVSSSERSIAPEVPYDEAVAAIPRLRALNKDDVYISSNAARYVATQKDLAALPQQTPTSVDEYLDRGNLFLDAGKFDDAIADFSKALELDPKNILALSDRGLAYVWKDQLETADKDLTAAAAIQPDDAVLLRARGLYFERKGDWKSAITFFERSLQSEPKSAFSLQHKAFAEMSAGLSDQALTTVQRGLTNDPNSIRFHAMRARILATQHKTDDALREIETLRNLKPADDETLAMIGSLYQMLGMPDRAKALYGQAVTLSSGDDASSLGRKAILEQQTGKTAEALADSAKALALDPHLQELRVLRANILYIRGERAAVAAEAASLIRENPTSDYAYVAAGKIYAKIGLNDEAFKAFDRAIAIRPKAYVYINRSQIRPRSDFNARLADLDAALKIEPNNFDALYAKSEVLRDSGDYAGALAALDAVDAGMQPQLRTQRAFLLYKSGHVDEATKQFETIRASTTDPTELNNLCYDKATAGIMLESALQDCIQALTLSPDNPGFEDSLGMVYLKLGKLDKAIAVYGKVLAQAPIPASYLGRAFAYQRKGDAAAAQKDRAEANSRMPGIEAEFAGYGLKFDTPLPAKRTPANKPKIVSVTRK